MLDINTVALIVLLNDPQTNMAALVAEPIPWGRWRTLATVVALIGVLLVAVGVALGPG